MTDNLTISLDLGPVEDLALTVTHDQYATGRIDLDELERRISTLIGLNGKQAREDALVLGASWIENTALGDPIPRRLITTWSWSIRELEAVNP